MSNFQNIVNIYIIKFKNQIQIENVFWIVSTCNRSDFIC